MNLVVVIAYPLSERGRNVQDGPEVWLICRIRFLLRVTEADQGAQVITARCKTQKLIREQKMIIPHVRDWHTATHAKQESQRQNQPNRMAHPAKARTE
jgi:hypothetical protein